jgi:hypothetical protein
MRRQRVAGEYVLETEIIAIVKPAEIRAYSLSVEPGGYAVFVDLNSSFLYAVGILLYLVAVPLFANSAKQQRDVVVTAVLLASIVGVTILSIVVHWPAESPRVKYPAENASMAGVVWWTSGGGPVPFRYVIFGTEFRAIGRGNVTAIAEVPTKLTLYIANGGGAYVEDSLWLRIDGRGGSVVYGYGRARGGTRRIRREVQVDSI